LLDDTGNYEDVEKLLGIKASDLQSGAYPYGYPWLDKFLNMWKYEMDPNAGRGIQGLTDGSNLLKSVTNQLLAPVVPAGVKSGEKMYFNIKPEDVVENSVKLCVIDANGAKVGAAVALGETYDNGGIKFTFERFQKTEGLVVISLGADVAASFTIGIDYDAYGMIPGVPTLWDLKGSVGAVRILLGGVGR
jgi:hypothetical protein